MTQQDPDPKTPETPAEKTAVHDHATHPEAGSQMREDKSFGGKPGGESADDAGAEIAADDAGASAMAEAAQKKAGAPEQPQ